MKLVFKNHKVLVWVIVVLGIVIGSLVFFTEFDINLGFYTEDREASEEKAAEEAEAKNVIKDPLNFLKTEVKGKYVVKKIPFNMTDKQKKKRFKALLVPPIQKVYTELQRRFEKVSEWLNEGTHAEEIAALKEEYKAETDQQLLAALKPHPPSIVLAQAALESAWGTSRFFVEAKNPFGVWSFDENEPRIAASKTREGKTIWVKKYLTLEESVRDYYRVLARGGAHQHFRDERLLTDNPYLLVNKLDNYAEIDEQYGNELQSIISKNKFSKYDLVFYERPKQVTVGE